MRIIGGSLKGRAILPAHLAARPTTDFAKEGLFNVLLNDFDLEQVKVLDLFGGSGSISFEFASRGCPDVTCVEMNPQHASFIKSTSKQLNLNAIRVVRHNVFDFIDICSQTYDIIFADPPFDLQGLENLPKKIIEKQLLRPCGFFILEHPGSFDFTETEGFHKMKKYGNVHFSFFR
ncbi:MAG: RsmD family RNA methyltransferase [Bacteroidales bacterium]|nr:RsmD family RNA methyltransferase [Bacteroidales bacterium]